MKKTILLTGAAGLFGCHLSRHFTNQGYRVIGIDNLSGGYTDYVDPQCDFHNCDLSDGKALNEIFKTYKPDFIIHTAAMAAVCLSPFIRAHNYNNNLVCYSNLVNCSINHNIKRFLHFSSMDVYGEAQVPFHENVVPLPEDPYGISKYAIELDLKSAHKQFGLNYNIIRPHNVFGVYQNIWDRYRNVLGIWIRKCMNEESITVYGDGMQKRAFSHIKFYMDPVEKLLLDENINQEIYNVGADNPITIIDAAKTVQNVAEKFGHNSDIEHLEPRNEVKEAFPDHTKAKTELDFHDNTDLETLVTDMYSWAMKQPTREVKYVDYEIEKGLYSYWKKDKC